MIPEPSPGGSPYGIGPDATGFRKVLRELADTFLEEVETLCGDLLDGHEAFLSTVEAGVLRTRGEHAIELLTLGLLREEYAHVAAATRIDEVERLEALWQVRSSQPARKAPCDAERGLMFLDILERDIPSSPATDEHLLAWLSATGEFVQESIRMRLWLESSRIFCPEDFLPLSRSLAVWFEREARGRLGPWTSGVDAYRRRILSERREREDLFLVTRSERLYHLNMLGSEVMNRGFRPGFEQCPDKVVLLPGCMRARPEGQCLACRDGLDISCTRCHPECEVARIDALGKTHSFRVFVVPHASSFTAWLKHWQGSPGTALIAAACPLHLVPGGYEMRALGLQAQCVLLEYSGCARHWDPAGRPTRIDHDTLLGLVEPRTLRVD
jgi:hypothetical protein